MPLVSRLLFSSCIGGLLAAQQRVPNLSKRNLGRPREAQWHSGCTRTPAAGTHRLWVGAVRLGLVGCHGLHMFACKRPDSVSREPGHVHTHCGSPFPSRRSLISPPQSHFTICQNWGLNCGLKRMQVERKSFLHFNVWLTFPKASSYT